MSTKTPSCTGLFLDKVRVIDTYNSNYNEIAYVLAEAGEDSGLYFLINEEGILHKLFKLTEFVRVQD